MKRQAKEEPLNVIIQLDYQSTRNSDTNSIAWATAYLSQALRNKGINVQLKNKVTEGDDSSLLIKVSEKEASHVKKLSQACSVQVPEVPESFAFFSESSGKPAALTVVGSDSRGLVYALLELADIAKHAADPIHELAHVPSCVEQPHTPVRSITRLFSSDVEDKSWFYDHSFWDEYLTELATQRFNQFTFGVGGGYDFLIDKLIEDNYFCFFYPFVLDVPGYDVRVKGLSAEEQHSNLHMLQYISEQAKLRGIRFRLGLWNHAYDYDEGKIEPAYIIQGLDEASHAAYSRDALKLLLQTCPDIEAVFFRVHFEGGIPEPTNDFWRVVMQGFASLGREVEIDFHAKGLDSELIEIATATGMPVVLSPKFWAEHLGPAYHRASIRKKEFYPKKKGAPASPNNPSHSKELGSGRGTEVTSSRSFTRYGYADYFHENRNYKIVHRVWPGTQRMLTWGDPVSAASYGRCGVFEGSSGFEWFEPLSFKGRKGSGSPGGRELYADEALQLATRDWTKYSYTYRLLGRLAYNPEADPETWRRYLRSEFQAAASSCEEAMAYASRILPFITLVHTPSVANKVYWPEMYTNMPITQMELPPGKLPRDKFGYPAKYDFDTESPFTFGSASPLDPELFYQINEFADDVLQGKRSGKYTPLEIADRLEAHADNAVSFMTKAQAEIPDAQQPSFRRWAVDVFIMAGTGHFFAHKFRSALAYALYERTGDSQLLKESLDYYHEARAAWKRIIDASEGVYKADITFGKADYTRGHWSDRLEAIDADIMAIEQAYHIAKEQSSGQQTLASILSPFQKGDRPQLHHLPAAHFEKGKQMDIQVSITESSAPLRIQLHYRHVNQSQSYHVVDMQANGLDYTASIPAAYTDSPYSLQYFFEAGYAGGDQWMAPGIGDALSNQPYYVLDANRS